MSEKEQYSTLENWNIRMDWVGSFPMYYSAVYSLEQLNTDFISITSTLKIFLKVDETKEYFGFLIGRHVAVFAATSHVLCVSKILFNDSDKILGVVCQFTTCHKTPHILFSKQDIYFLKVTLFLYKF